METGKSYNKDLNLDLIEIDDQLSEKEKIKDLYL